MMRERARRVLRCNKGATAIEFALVTPAFLALVLGGISVCVLLYSNVSLQDAVEQGARCYSLGTCADPTTYAHGLLPPGRRSDLCRYHPHMRHQVEGKLTLQTAAVLTNITVPLDAEACCFP